MSFSYTLESKEPIGEYYLVRVVEVVDGITQERLEWTSNEHILKDLLEKDCGNK